MSATRVLALATLFLATTFARAEWKEFRFPDGNFGVVFPESPQRLRGARRNLHQFSATAGAESYEGAYADYSPRTDWKNAVDGKRDSIVSSPGRVGGGREGHLSCRSIPGNGFVLSDRTRASGDHAAASGTGCTP